MARRDFIGGGNRRNGRVEEASSICVPVAEIYICKEGRLFLGATKSRRLGSIRMTAVEKRSGAIMNYKKRSLEKNAEVKQRP